MKRLLHIISLTILTALLLAVPALASVTSDITKPTSGPYITKVYGYQNCLVLGDQLFVAQINIPYSTVPTIPSSSAYLGRLLDGSGAEVVSTPVYSYFNTGYGYNTFAIYLDAANAITWNSAVHSMDLSGSPTLNWLDNTATTAMSGAITTAAGDETAEANSVAANDVTLLPSPVAMNAVYYFGSVYDFNKLTVNIGTPGVGVWTTTWEYWNGSGWSALSGVVDGTSYFMAPVGNHDVTFTIPDDWVATVVAPVVASQMWVRVRVDSYTSTTTQPLGTQVWVNGNGTYPTNSIPSTAFTWNTSATIAGTQNLIYTQTILWADYLTSKWNIALTEITSSGKVLSGYGIEYFPNVISNLQQICPKLFSTSVTVPQYVDKSVNLTGAAAAEASWPFDFSGVAHWLGFTGTDMVFRSLLALLLIFFVTSWVSTKNLTASVPTAFGLVVGFASVGWLSPILAAGLAFMAALLFGLVFLLGKPST